MTTETITWHDAARELPDDEMVVLIYAADIDGDPLWLGHMDAGQWYAVENLLPLPDGMVTHWADVPAGPDAEMRDAIARPSQSPRWELGQTVTLNGDKHTVTDIDYGYGVLHLDGKRYSAPGDPQNDGIVAKMCDCVASKETDQ